MKEAEADDLGCSWKLTNSRRTVSGRSNCRRTRSLSVPAGADRAEPTRATAPYSSWPRFHPQHRRGAGAGANPGAIRRTALLTVEGERDDICGLGQTLAAQDLCTGLRQYMKMHHVQTGVGHYGVFSGRRWNNEVYPMVRDIIQMTV
jgi:PHB de-polymerase C-terminus